MNKARLCFFYLNPCEPTSSEIMYGANDELIQKLFEKGQETEQVFCVTANNMIFL